MNRRAMFLLCLMWIAGILLAACAQKAAQGAPTDQDVVLAQTETTTVEPIRPRAARLTRAALPPSSTTESPTTEATITPTPPPEALPRPGGAATPAAEILRGVAFMSASTIDEYRGTDNRGGQYAAVTFNMMEQLVRLRGFNVGPWGDWGEPRRTGYEYNWARSGATSYTLIQMGQHTGVAEQIARGDVTFVVIFIGANDFSPVIGSTYTRIYDGRLSDERLQKKIQDAIDAVTLATDTVLDAGAMGVAVFLFPHWNLDPAMELRFPDDAGRQRVEDAIDAVNEGIKAMAAERNILLIDPNEYVRELMSQLDENGMLNVDGELLDFRNPGNEPHHARLADKSGHAGTILSGLMANEYVLKPLNAAYGTDIPLLTVEEILTVAGIRP